MSNLDKRIEFILKKIKENPKVDSKDLDDRLVHDLVDSGLLSGWNVSSSSTPDDIDYEYENLMITMDGEAELERISYMRKNDPMSIWRTEKIWLPLLYILLGFILGKYFG